MINTSIFTNFVNTKVSTSAKQLTNKVDDLFVQFKLNVPNTNVFENPAFLKWAQSVDDFNLQNADKAPKSMLPTLMRQYETIPLSTMLEAAKKVESTRDVATRLQNEQMKLWKNGGLTTDQLFTAYKLDVLNGGVKNLLANPGVKIWIKYADDFYPGTTLYDKLRKTYSDDAVLSKLLIAGMEDSKTKTLATELQTKLVKDWTEKLQPPAVVFKFLALDKGADNLLASPHLRTWVQYAEGYKGNNDFTTKLTLFEALKTNYNDDVLVHMINSAQYSVSKQEIMYAENVLDGLLGKWAQQPVKLRSVLEKLDLTKEKATVVKSVYIDKLRAVKPN
ncbi:Avirulence (Avh) protein [Phytophthora megakarya]|uniref:Avirulence (Avh) protein n=1 Tax=Phytophthora megakarya TaxID=4795 RepID=A0A225VW68_9STRA|nr:Avirulence (Avh) protein [Phytophthora megakarya]